MRKRFLQLSRNPFHLFLLVILYSNFAALVSPKCQANDKQISFSDRNNLSLEASKKQLESLKIALRKAQGVRRKLLDKTSSLDTDIKELRKRLLIGASLIRDHEIWVRDLRTELGKVNYSLLEKKKKLKENRKRVGRLLLALYRVSKYPLESVIVNPIVPGDALRSALLLRTVVANFHKEIDSLIDDLDFLAVMQKEVEQRQIGLTSVKRELEAQRKVMRTLMGRKSRLRRRVAAKSNLSDRRLKVLAKQANSIQSLILKLERLKQKRKLHIKGDVETASDDRELNEKNERNTFSSKSLKIVRGKLLLPVVGRMVAKFGESGKKGSTHKGLTILTGLDAQVIAPFDGRVAFAGLFRGYGELLIIEHTGGYHTLLAGMSKIDSVVGQWLVAGEPVGHMGKKGSLGSIKAKPILYMEMRHSGSPINPLPWLAVNQMEKGKMEVSG